jgi:hypothetical protein
VVLLEGELGGQGLDERGCREKGAEAWSGRRGVGRALHGVADWLALLGVRERGALHGVQSTTSSGVQTVATVATGDKPKTTVATVATVPELRESAESAESASVQSRQSGESREGVRGQTARRRGGPADVREVGEQGLGEQEVLDGSVRAGQCCL